MRLFNLTRIFICFVLSVGLPEAQSNDWGSHKTSLNASVAKIRSKEGQIADLIKIKKTLKDQAAMSEVLIKLTKEHKELTDFYKEFEKEQQHIRFEHPDQGELIERQYRPYRLKSLNEFETEGGLDGQLTDLREKVRKKYGDPKTPEPSPTPVSRIEILKREKEDQDKKRIKVSY